MPDAIDQLLTIAKSIEGSLRKPQPLAERQPNASDVFGTPFIRKGENSLGSRPFYLSNVVGAAMGGITPDQAKIELDQCRWFSKAMRDFGGGGYENVQSVLVPMSWDALPQQVNESQEGQIFKSMMVAGNRNYDRMEAAWQLNQIRKADQSAYAYNLGGTFVPPPEFGEPIELLRNQEVFLAAGATRVALPPQGSMQFPRMTSPTTAAPQPEAKEGAYSNVATGDVTLTAKAYSVYVRMSNQLVRFAPALANGLITSDMMKSASLKIDLDALEGPIGGTNNIRGLITYANINRVTASTVGANGNTLGRKDGKRMMSQIYANNAKMSGWIMRYEMFLNTISEFAADAVTAGDAAGMYLYNLLRDVGNGPDFNWLKFPVHCSNQVSKSRTKGTATNLTYIVAGDFPDYLFGMHGALELATNMFGDTAWRQNQTELRAIVYADSAPRHEVSFSLCDQLTYVS